MSYCELGVGWMVGGWVSGWVETYRNSSKGPIPLLLHFIDLTPEFLLGGLVPLSFFDEGTVVCFRLYKERVGGWVRGWLRR